MYLNIENFSLEASIKAYKLCNCYFVKQYIFNLEENLIFYTSIMLARRHKMDDLTSMQTTRLFVSAQSQHFSQ